MICNECSFITPIGRLQLHAREGALVEVQLLSSDRGAQQAEREHRGSSADHVLQLARRQLEEYFGGERFAFTLPLAPQGTPFQLHVLRALAEIPFGATVSYAELAARIGRPRAVRAVGSANARNPLAIVLPCHRVVGSRGSLVGFAWGLPLKQWLLDHERRVLESRMGRLQLSRPSEQPLDTSRAP